MNFLDYLGGLTINTRVLIKDRQKVRQEKRGYIAGFVDGERSREARDVGDSRRWKKSKKQILSRASRITQPFGPILDFWTPEL